MLVARSAPLVLASSLAGFVLCFGFVGGCGLFGSDDETAGSSSSTSGDGGQGEGGQGGGTGAGGMTSSSGSSGMPVVCTDHTNLDETNCGLIKQDCQSPAEMCVPNGSATTCVYQTGVKGVGANCTDEKECGAGLTCVFFTCAPYCCPSAAQAFCGSAKCNVNISLGGGGNVWACNLSKACTLFGNDCPENQQCRFGDPDQELSLCAPSSNTPVPEGGSCMFLNDCGANQVCTDNVCHYNCSLPDWDMKEPGAGGCPSLQTCIKAYMNSDTVGICGT